MKQKVPSAEYLEKAMALTHEEAERLFARMRGKLVRRMKNAELRSLDAIALQLQAEDEDLEEWRQQWADVVDRANNPGKKSRARN